MRSPAEQEDQILQATAVFTPGSFPVHTYVRREADEAQLRSAVETDGMLVSVAGPTKTGKTVLVNQVVGEEKLVSVSESSIAKASDLWDAAAAEMNLGGLPQREVVDLARDDDRVLLVDDFHYVARGVQTLIAQQLKDAIARGLRVIVAAVPHRSDDAIRGNADLRGRVMTIDLDYWTLTSLGKSRT